MPPSEESWDQCTGQEHRTTHFQSSTTPRPPKISQSTPRSCELSVQWAGCHLPEPGHPSPPAQPAHTKRHQEILPQLLHQLPSTSTGRATAICMRWLQTWSLCKLSVLCLSLMINWAPGSPSAQDFLWLRSFAASQKLKYISCPADTVYSLEQFLLDL